MLQDASLPNQTASSLRAALAPKATAASRLQQRLAGLTPLGSMQLFSSIASLLGSSGQANYAAANAALDGQADRWQRQVCGRSRGGRGGGGLMGWRQ